MQIDEKKFYETALEHFKNLIKFDTTNPPGNEKPAAEYIAGHFKNAGIETDLIETAHNRACVIGRMKGVNSSAGPLMLESHLDVVPAEKAMWAVDPFSAEVKNGSLYGRGAVDMKNMTALSMTAMLAMRSSGAMPERDVLFVAVADEETGGKFGARYLSENRRELVEAEFMLGEVGGFSIHNKSGKTLYPIGVAEKGVLWLKVKARGLPGHGSMPHSQNSVLKIGRALARIEKKNTPVHITPVVSAFITQLAQCQPFPNSKVLPLLLNPHFSNRILALIPSQSRKLFNAFLHNTITPTIIRAGTKTNVIPSTAEVELDIRILPASSRDDVLKEVRDILDEEYEIEEIEHFTPTEQGDYQSPLYDSICRALNRNDAGCEVAPYLIPGFTDAHWFSKLGTRCYGFVPIRFDEHDEASFGDLFHGHNERIPLSGFEFGCRVFMNTLSDFLKV